LQKHLRVSDYYSGLHTMHSRDFGRSWSAPQLQPPLDWVRDSGDVDIAVADVTPSWHAPTGKVLAIGAQVRYSSKGEQLEDKHRANQTSYAVYDPKTDGWSKWKVLDMPPHPRFEFARSACAQWIVQPDGTCLLPYYFGHDAKQPWSVTVVQCAFNGSELRYLRHGNEMELDVVRGLVEPSITRFREKYYLTLRNDEKGYVTVSDDGLNFAPIKPWTFDDGTELGSYNTQQHWATHSDGLFLCYTRRGGDNDHIFRHRAPLFIAQVDPKTLIVLRATERILIPERGATLGNFGVTEIDERETWVTVSEGMWTDDARRRGAKGATFLVRLIWSKPNRLVHKH
jgi:hypothetical protein